MVKYAVIATSSYDSSNYSDILNFKDIICNEIDYKYVCAFSQHIDEDLYDYVFESRESYETWLESGIDTTITKVTYDWENSLAYITIADTNFPGPHEFDCTEEWTTEECEAAINGKFSIE